MSKRKRLYERGNSYNDTGIPCGNPKRVRTGEVLCMPNASGAMRSAEQQEINMETQGEEQLRTMAQKQLKTNISMHELQSQRRQFTEAGRYKPVIQEIKGVMKLQEYEDIAKGDQRVDTLRQYGLTDDEIRLQLGREGVEKGNDSVGKNKSTYGANPEVHQDQLHAIDTKIKEKEASLAIPDTFRGLKEISRQEMDIEKSMFWGADHDSNVLSNLLTEKKSQVTGDPNDPINHLPQLMADIEDRAREKIKEKRRRRRKNRRKANNCDTFDISTVSDKTREDSGSDGETGGVIGCLMFEEMMALKQSEKTAAGSDAKTSNTVSGSTPSELNLNERCSYRNTDMCDDTVIDCGSNLNSACANDKGCASTEESGTVSGTSTQSDRKIIKGPIEFLPVEYIEENRLSLEQIRELPKFTNYEAGDLSNVLYVKNLSPRCSEHNLVSLFGRFQKETESQIVYRLMTGRMRGQAFVTFDSIDVATQAMQLVNGFVLHGKPVIVHYGKRNTA